jgi:hypothetical protein
MGDVDARQSDGSSVLYFMHIQKNAGNALRDWLHELFADDFFEFMVQGRCVDGCARTWSKSPEETDQVRQHIAKSARPVVAGNLPYGLHEHLSIPVRYLTILRDPLIRCYSFWHHAFRLRDHGNAWHAIEDGERDQRGQDVRRREVGRHGIGRP